MKRIKYRVWLISLALAAAILGVVWYAAGREEEKTITDGTLVWQEMSGQETGEQVSFAGWATHEDHCGEKTG